MSSPTPEMIVKKEAHIGWMIFNNPLRMNAVTLDMWNAIPEIVTDFEADPEFFHDPGTKSFLQDIRALDELETGFHRFGLLQVQRDRTAAAARNLELGTSTRTLTIDTDNVGSHIVQKHGAERARPDACEFNNLDAGKRPASHFARSLGNYCCRLLKPLLAAARRSVNGGVFLAYMTQRRLVPTGSAHCLQTPSSCR